ncbi:MAG: hypothetical protein AAB426_04805, partial [Myxococcota bacterium]
MALAAVSLLACRSTPLGNACTEDAQCGPGYDCFRDVCVQLCTSETECGKDQRCDRYHCVGPGAPIDVSGNVVARPAKSAVPRATAARGSEQPSAVSQPATPDATLIELRALRRDVELLRRDQQQVLELLQRGTAAPASTPSAPTDHR